MNIIFHYKVISFYDWWMSLATAYILDELKIKKQLSQSAIKHNHIDHIIKEKLWNTEFVDLWSQISTFIFIRTWPKTLEWKT